MCNVLNGHFVFCQKSFCFFASRLIDIFRNGISGDFVEGSGKIAFTHSTQLCQLVKRERPMTFRMDESDYRFDCAEKLRILMWFFACNAVSSAKKVGNRKQKCAKRENSVWRLLVAKCRSKFID